MAVASASLAAVGSAGITASATWFQSWQEWRTKPKQERREDWRRLRAQIGRLLLRLVVLIGQLVLWLGAQLLRLVVLIGQLVLWLGAQIGQRLAARIREPRLRQARIREEQVRQARIQEEQRGQARTQAEQRREE